MCGTPMLWHMCGGQRSLCGHQFSPSTMEVLVVRFRSYILGRRHLPHLTNPEVLFVLFCFLKTVNEKDPHGDIDCYTILHMDGLANKGLRPQNIN